jgi:hypothetical protein
VHHAAVLCQAALSKRSKVGSDAVMTILRLSSRQPSGWTGEVFNKDSRLPALACGDFAADDASWVARGKIPLLPLGKVIIRGGAKVNVSADL